LDLDDEDFFVSHARGGPQTFNINRYPPLTVTGAAKDGQFRVAPHTDWGILTILDRQPGYGGLQVQNLDDTWADAPYVPDALTVNVADLLSRWSGGRWRSTRHRVLPPPAQAPDEELISLIVFLEAEVDTVIKPVAGDLGIEPVVAGDWLRERESAATVLWARTAPRHARRQRGTLSAPSPARQPYRKSFLVGKTITGDDRQKLSRPAKSSRPLVTSVTAGAPGMHDAQHAPSRDRCHRAIRDRVRKHGDGSAARDARRQRDGDRQAVAAITRTQLARCRLACLRFVLSPRDTPGTRNPRVPPA
jgi:hypothetical protein